MKPQLIVIDLDGTLLDRSGRVPDVNRDAVRLARNNGLEVIVATGRNWAESRPALSAIDANGMMICAGGAMLCDAVEGTGVRTRPLPVEAVHDITRRLIAHGHLVHLLQDHGRSDVEYIMVGTAETDPATAWWLKEHDVRTRFIEDPDGLDLQHTLRVGTVGHAERLQSTVEDIESVWGDDVELQHWPAVVESAATGTTTHLLEIFDRGVDKWTMIEHLLAERGLGPEHVVAIGDGLNDIMMVREAGCGIAMGQANATVHAVADHVVSSHEEGGVVAAIEHVLGLMKPNGGSGNASGGF